jgi:signal transduction histidine kinase
MRDAGLSLRFYPGADVGFVPLDWDHLHAAIANLLRNAKDATPAGGEIMLSSARDGAFLILRVTDTGSGIPAELQPRVFEPYFSTKKSGTGLGLPMVRRVAEEHGGSLSMQSEVGKGTQFTLRLPAPSSAAEAEPNA